MPVTVSAKKALRRDRQHQKFNLIFRRRVKAAMKTAKKKPSAKTLNSAFSLIDRAAKKHLYHLNKAARLKSRLSRLLSKISPQKNSSK